MRCCCSCWADGSSANRREVALSEAWMVVGGEFMRFVDDEEEEEGEEVSFALIERMNLYGCLLI